jgi:hypothetical protein
MKKRLIRGGLAVLAAITLLGALTACDEDRALSVPQSFCGFIQGKGSLDNNNNVNSADLKQVLYAGQSQRYNSEQDFSKVFPCVTRNYVVSAANISGDSHQPLTGFTSEGIPVSAYVTLYWQPNQAPVPMKDFIGFCQGKYGCAADNPDPFNGTNAQGQNNSTDGWNKMLAENVFPVLQRVFDAASRTVGNEVWKNQDPKLRAQIAQAMADQFSSAFQVTTGSTQDLVCGSGSTGIGTEFNCKEVTIVIDGLWASQGTMQQDSADAAAAQAKTALDEANKQADINLTNDKYGPVLGPQFRACRDLGGSCKFVVGPQGIQVQTGP